MLFSTIILLSSLLAVNACVVEDKSVGGYVQESSGSASFTVYSGCGSGACGIPVTGYTAAMNQLAYGAPPGQGAGDACGRCFALNGTEDPYSPNYSGPFYSIVVKVTNLCPYQENEKWCGQSVSKPENQYGKKFHFDICEDSGASDAFFPKDRGALLGDFKEVSCSEWQGRDGTPAWGGACLDGESSGNWPATGCGNRGAAPS